jgi:hypothetical protein
MSCIRVLCEPVRGTDEPLGEQADVEAQVRRTQVDGLFIRGE